MKQNEISLGRFLRILLLIAGLFAAYFVVDSLSGVLLPFVVAWFLAYLLQPLVSFIQHKLRFKFRTLSIVAALMFIAAVIYGVIMLVVPSILDEVFALKNITLSFVNQNLTNTSIPGPVVDFFKEFMKDNDLASILNSEVGVEINSIALDKLSKLLFGTVDVLQAALTFGIMMLYLFFILLDFERITESWKLYIPQNWRGVATKLWDDLVQGMDQYFRGQALVAFCVGVLFSIGFVIIDFPAAIAFGMFTGMLNMVPYLQVLSVVPMVLLSMLEAANTGGDFWFIMLSAFAVLAVVQVIQDMFLVPKIMGKRMNLHPAVILLSLSIWGHLLGVLGMIVALPLTTLILAYLKRYHEVAATSGYSQPGAFKEAIDSTVFGKEDGEGQENNEAETPM
ncbi:MAG: AI-2E family transporter [Bacteroidaceae bacterium]|nr:AI-2E family transporter [Bacteroidaceae bacterium]